MDYQNKLRLTYVGLAMLLHNMISIIVSLVVESRTSDIPSWLNVVFTVLIYLLSFAVPFFFLSMKYPIRISEDNQAKRHVPTGTLYSAFAIMGLSYVALRVGKLILTALSHFNIGEFSVAIDFTDDIPSFIVYFLFYVLIAPIVEELFYRGLILQTLMPLGSGTALIFTTLFFSLSHVGLSGILYALVSGLFIGALVIRYKSVKVGIIAHMVNNFINFILSVSLELTGTAGDRIINFIFPVVAVLCGIWWFFTFGRHLLKLKNGENHTRIILHPPIFLFFVIAVFAFVSGFYRG